METLKLLITIFLLLDSLLLLLGLWRPVIVLWWLEYQNRKKVIKYYGTSMLMLLAVWLLL